MSMYFHQSQELLIFLFQFYLFLNTLFKHFTLFILNTLFRLGCGKLITPTNTASEIAGSSPESLEKLAENMQAASKHGMSGIPLPPTPADSFSVSRSHHFKGALKVSTN